MPTKKASKSGSKKNASRGRAMKQETSLSSLMHNIMDGKSSKTRSTGAKKSSSKKSASSSGGAKGGGLSLAQFLKAKPQDGYSAVFLINPQDSTPETLRVAWPETCLACGHWFDFPASVVESIIPLGVEECCASPIPKVALRIKPQHDSIIDMLRTHLAGTLGSETSAQAPVQTRGLRAVTFAEEEMCGAEAEAARATRGVAEDVAAAAADAVANLELSGAHWVQRFPGSRSIFDTKPPFLDKLSKFHQALLEAGAQVAINATFRPPERAYLMHFCVKISKGEIDPRQVPPMAGVGIQWFHGDLASSKQAAAQMAEAYNIAFPPSLRSRHTQGLAIDMTITWTGTLNIKDATGATRAIGAPRTGHENAALHRVGATYGVIKLVSDRPHWSSDGH